METAADSRATTPSSSTRGLRKRPDTKPTGNHSNHNIYQSILFGVLKPMTRGRLKVVLPDGTEKVFGQDASSREAVIHVLAPAFFKKCVLAGDIGFGESYVGGDWETGSVSDVVAWFILNAENCPAVSGGAPRRGWLNLLLGVNKLIHFFRRNTLKGSKKNIQAHYDLSNDFFRIFLDPGMTYSCAYFKTPDQDLQDAQDAKFERFCRKLRLTRTDHVLEIGGGWGGFSVYAAKNYGCRVTSITISKKQFDHAARRIRNEGLAEQVDVKLMDYRQLGGQFDKIVSIEMLEAVGDRYFETFFSKCHEVLKHDGLLGLQVITCPDSRYEELRKNVDWIQKHIFPGSLLPSIARINTAVRKTGDLSLHELEDMGPFYVQTLTRWHQSFNARLEEVHALGFDNRFIRKWNYYFEYCKAAFQTRNISVVQAVYTRPNNKNLFVQI